MSHQYIDIIHLKGRSLTDELIGDAGEELCIGLIEGVVISGEEGQVDIAIDLEREIETPNKTLAN